MAAQSWPAQGATFSIDEIVPPSGTYTLIGEIISMSHVGGGEVGERDTTVLANTVRTNAPTIPDNGEMSYSVNHDPTDAVHQFVRDLKDVPSIHNFKATLNTTGTTSTIVFSAWVKDWDGVNLDDVDASLTADITLRVTGGVTWVPS